MNHLRLLADANLGTIQGTGNFQPSIVGGAGTGASQIEHLLTVVIGFLTIVGGLTFLIYFLMGALNWITGGGNEKKVEEAKGYMTNGAIGLIAIIAAYSIIAIIGKVLGLEILTPANTLENLLKPSVTNNTLF